MSISIKKLFKKQIIDNEVISLRNSLSNHYQGSRIGLGEAYRSFLKPADGNGFVRGCHRPSQNVAGELAHVVPSWVPVHDHETRTVEGVLALSKITHTDFPLKPWHTYYDWNFFVIPDKQYTYLLSESNFKDHGGTIECEWDTGDERFLPSWAWPQEGNRMIITGRWIYDCGHPEAHGHKTEIHPPKAVISFRTEAVKFTGNSGATRANNAIIFIGRNGGYWRHAINDQNYAFDLHLPPKPYPEAVPKYKVTAKTDHLPVQPQIVPYPGEEPKQVRVMIPLKGVTPHPENYGAIISAGWSDPLGTESRVSQRVRVKILKIHMHGNYDTWGDEWHVYVGINGRWKVWKDIGGNSKSLNFSVTLDLHPNDEINISACGFEADVMHDHMGENSGYSWAEISDTNMTKARKEEIEDDVFWQLSGSFNDENDRIGLFSVRHASEERGFLKTKSHKGDYTLEYSIETP